MASGYYYYFLFEEEGWNSSVNDVSIEDAENNYNADNIDGTVDFDMESSDFFC